MKTFLKAKKMNMERTMQMKICTSNTSKKIKQALKRLAVNSCAA